MVRFPFPYLAAESTSENIAWFRKFFRGVLRVHSPFVTALDEVVGVHFATLAYEGFIVTPFGFIDHDVAALA